MAIIFAIALTMWRGETRYVKLPDNVEIPQEVPSGIELKVGKVMPVQYTLPNDPKRQVYTTLDRVEWGKDGSYRYAEVKVLSKQAPGKYTFGAFELTVEDKLMPPAKEWKYYLDLWQHPWAVARYFKVKPFSPEHYAKMRPLWTMLGNAGQKALTVTIIDLPWNHQCYDGYYSMMDKDFKLFDEYVEFGRSCGIGPHIQCYTMCPWKETLKPGSPEFEAKWAPFLKEFSAHLKAKGWFQDVFMAMDERSPRDVKAIADLVQKYAPGMKISMAGNRKPSDFNGIEIDSYSQQLGLGAEKDPAFMAELEARRKAGKITTCYVCCVPQKPNTFLTSPINEARELGAFPAKAGFDGLLRWAYNSWPADPMNDGSFGNWAPGDTYLVYPDCSPSVRFLELYNGIVEAEKNLL